MRDIVRAKMGPRPHIPATKLFKRFWRALGRRYLDWWTLGIVVAAGYFAALTHELPRSAAVWIAAGAAAGILVATAGIAVFLRWKGEGVAGDAADGIIGHRHLFGWSIALAYALNATLLTAAGGALVGAWSMTGVGGPFVARFAAAGFAVLAARYTVDLARMVIDFRRGCLMLLAQRGRS